MEKEIDVLGYKIGIPSKESGDVLSIEKYDFLTVKIILKNVDGSTDETMINVQQECGCTSDDFIDEFNKLNK